MCTIGYNRYTCGCTRANLYSLRLCEYAKLKGIECPDFQTDEDSSLSKKYDMACPAHWSVKK